MNRQDRRLSRARKRRRATDIVEQYAMRMASCAQTCLWMEHWKQFIVHELVCLTIGVFNFLWPDANRGQRSDPDRPV